MGMQEPDTRRIDLTLEPLDDYVVIQPSDEESETNLGLIIPASAETDSRTGVVTAVGAETGGVEPGDKVLFPSDAGYEVRLAGTAVKVLRRGELIARVHDDARSRRACHVGGRGAAEQREANSTSSRSSCRSA
jgi:chaperonin GroES